MAIRYQDIRDLLAKELYRNSRSQRHLESQRTTVKPSLPVISESRQFICSVSDDSEKRCFMPQRLSSALEEKVGIGGVIGLLWQGVADMPPVQSS